MLLSCCIFLECRDLADGGDDLIRRDQLRTFKVAVRAFVTGTPQEVEVVEVQPHIVPAAVAGMIIDHTIRRFKFVGRVGEAGDHHHRHFAAPGKPAQTAAQADEEIRILDEIDPVLQGISPVKSSAP